MRKSGYLLLFAGIIIVNLCWQCNPFKKEKPLSIIAGTVVSLRLPEGFEPAPTQQGFKHKKFQASIMLVEIPRTFGIASKEVEAGDSVKGGMQVLSKKEIQVDGRNGLLYHLGRKLEGRGFNQWMLVLPNAHHTAAITGTYPSKHEQALSDQIREALLTTRIEKDEKALYDSLPFEVDFASSPLQPAKVIAGTAAVYTADGVWSDSSMQSRAFYVGRGIPKAEETEDFARDEFSWMCSTCDLDSSSVKPIVIDNLKGFELWGYTQGTHKLKYMTILYDEAAYFLMVGTALREQEENLKMFQSLSRKFKKRDSIHTHTNI